ncbi:uracil DNA glycosylase [Neocucurbitaria cava]|uniref:Uracil DNA glycosylase n=1 Tax=Neocucurbitaria cava TaxID=798079 RepID=A0A9W8Y3N2_9PLEO|nr:uracil DNA glycosylase [Neocucurbitaria cava]
MVRSEAATYRLDITSRIIRDCLELKKQKRIPHAFCSPSPHFFSTFHSPILSIATATMSLKRKAAEAASDAKKPKMNGSITAFFGAPKPSPNKATPKFDKDAWVTKLTDEQKELLQLEIDTLHDSWLPHLKDVLVSPQFLELKRFLRTELKSGKTVYPPMKDVYSWYAFCERVDSNVSFANRHG